MRERGRKCENCGSALPKRSRFCPECGTRVAGETAPGDTAVDPPPPSETGPVPVTLTAAEPRYFGVTPTMLVFALAVASLAVGVLLLATRHWIAGALCVGASLLLFSAFGEVARRKPDSAVARASVDAVDTVRARARAAVEAVTIRSRASRELVRRRQDLLALSADRAERLRELGEAVYSGEKADTKRLRAEIAELDEQTAAKEAEMYAIATQAQERIDRARLEVRPTEMVEVPEPPGPPGPSPEPTPAPVPEPFPPAIPEPSPTPVPEPYPPPDEVTPPEPARVPEPGPLDKKRPRARKK